MIKTVRGLIHDEELGFTHSHEHIWIGDILPESCPVLPLDDYLRSLAELQAFSGCGGKTIVDCNPPGSGGDISVLKRLSEESGVNIIASSGFHRDMFYKDKLSEHSVNELMMIFRSDIKSGAGVIKTAVESCGIDTQSEKNKHEAAARIAVEEGLPVIMHIEKDCELDPIIDYYALFGLTPDRMILCHCDRMIDDLSRHRQALKRGVYLEYDTIHRPKYHDDRHELEIITQMVNEFPGQILLGLDSTRQRLGQYGGDTPLTYMIDTFIPYMLDGGINEEQIRQLFINNPVRAFRYDK